jgi:hypothetical protein
LTGGDGRRSDPVEKLTDGYGQKIAANRVVARGWRKRFNFSESFTERVYPVIGQIGGGSNQPGRAAERGGFSITPGSQASKQGCHRS